MDLITFTAFVLRVLGLASQVDVLRHKLSDRDFQASLSEEMRAELRARLLVDCEEQGLDPNAQFESVYASAEFGPSLVTMSRSLQRKEDGTFAFTYYARVIDDEQRNDEPDFPLNSGRGDSEEAAFENLISNLEDQLRSLRQSELDGPRLSPEGEGASAF